MGSLASSSDQAPDGIAQKTRGLFGRKNLNAQIVNPGDPECTTEATDVHMLRMGRGVMSDHTSRNFGPTRRKASALGEAPGIVLPGCDEPSGLWGDVEAFYVDPDAVQKMRRRDAFFSLIDIAMMITRKDATCAGQQLKLVQDKYPEIHDDIQHIQFPGQGQRETPACDILTLTRIVVRLPNANLRHCLQILLLLGESVGASENEIMRAANTTARTRRATGADRRSKNI